MSYDEASRPGRSSWARPAAAVAGVGLAAIACLHAVWALGSGWPFGDREAMAKVVWGGPLATFPSPAATMFVAVLIGAAALVVTGRGGLWGGWAPKWVFAAGTWTLATVLFLRALVYGLGSIGSDAVNSAWERALFTPLCIVLAVLCAIVGRDAGRDRVSAPSTTTRDPSDTTESWSPPHPQGHP